MARLIVQPIYALCTWSLARTTVHVHIHNPPKNKRLQCVTSLQPHQRGGPVQSNQPVRRVTSRTAASRSRTAQVARRLLLHLFPTTTTRSVRYDSLGLSRHHHYFPGKLQTLLPRLRVRLPTARLDRSCLAEGLTASPRHHTINMI